MKKDFNFIDRYFVVWLQQQIIPAQKIKAQKV